MTDIKPVVVAYSVCAMPDDHIDHHLFELKVEQTHSQLNTWAVRWMGRCLDADGGWDYEPLPSSREDDWLAAHRFDLETALAIAVKAAPSITVNGWTPATALARRGGAS